MAGAGLAAHHRGGRRGQAGLRRRITHRRERQGGRGIDGRRQEAPRPAPHDGHRTVSSGCKADLSRTADRSDARPTVRRGEGCGDGRVPRRRNRCSGVHHRNRGWRRCAQRHGDARDGRRPIRHQPAAPAARPHRPRRSIPACAFSSPNCRKARRRANGSRRWRRRWTASNWPTSTSEERREGDVLGYSQSGRAITLRFLSLFEHLEIICRHARFASRSTRKQPSHPGMAVLAAQFVDTDRVEYLEKA